MEKYIKHFITITKHIYYVRKFCFKCGFYKRGLLHDLSKYSPIEFFSSARHFQGTSSPIDADKKAKGYSLAWQHHKGHNPHHWEYWIDNIGTYKNTPIKIPYEYVVEMICDWLGAGIVYSKNKVDFNVPYKEPLNYYKKCVNERIFNEETKKLIETYLGLISVNGINAFCEYVKCRNYTEADYNKEYLP